MELCLNFFLRVQETIQIRPHAQSPRHRIHVINLSNSLRRHGGDGNNNKIAYLYECGLNHQKQWKLSNALRGVCGGGGEWGRPGVWWADSKWWQRRMLRIAGTKQWERLRIVSIICDFWVVGSGSALRVEMNFCTRAIFSSVSKLNFKKMNISLSGR